jgi:16S rRNA (uracil1498-N3)-methyltransferase
VSLVRLPVPAARIAPRVGLTPQERHYLVDVLRLSPGACLEVFDMVGGRYRARLVSEQELELSAREADEAGERTIVLAQALIRGEKMDYVVQKATELGVSAFAPFGAARSVVKLEGGRSGGRVQRWQRIAEEAARQCGRARVPAVHPVGKGLAAVLERARADAWTTLVLFEGERSRGLAAALGEAPGPLLLCVGPEGGFAPEEVDLARRLGAQTVGLGEAVLRAETAGLAALTIARFLEGRLG